ncbi:hypothetical protein [Comamonas aquatica]|uniref:hypothetical protein n=1 Tax=Comamonas aquatica TaxID=225991 RepID=UPI00244D05C7|nr:hypothetical protein [Comamonas aquatica]MDH1815611.1 hypothetical protein [Comamonas aquatica]
MLTTSLGALLRAKLEADAISPNIQQPEIQETKGVYTPSNEELGKKKAPLSMQNSSLQELQANNLAGFIQSLSQHRFWHILPEGQNDTSKSLGIFDTQNQRIWPRDTTASFSNFLKQNPFAYVINKKSVTQATLHSKTRLLWNNNLSDTDYLVKDAESLLKKEQFAGLAGWQAPSKEMLKSFATADNNPYQSGQRFRLKTAAGGSTFNWLTNAGVCDVDEGCWKITVGPGRIFACNPYWEETQSELSMLLDIAQRDWRLRSPYSDTVFEAPTSDSSWQGLSIEALLMDWVQQRVYLRAEGKDAAVINPHDFWTSGQFAQLDYAPCRLPELDKAQLTDPEKGLWELWGEDPAHIKLLGLVARDPGRDVQNRAVAIDFGTSSTVVAMNTPTGARELLRIGVRDFFQAVKAQDFENPTVLECVDYPAFSQAWTANAYRPALNWDWMRAAHEAREHFRDNPGDTKILTSILPLLKQWALRTGDHQRKRLTDQQEPGHEMELEPHTERNPVRGQPLAVSAGDAFDPIELYAWYLGMAINWRGRGLFLKYYLSFPVKYPSEVKQRILASFRRGLQRSLPQTLVTHHPQVLNDFEVNDIATEPAAYAAAALPHLNVEPTEEGVPYAVFDFGGGTSDFDYGLLRWATRDEEDQGYERVFEHLGSSGDNFLGGENLLEHLVYESFQQNLPMLREKRIQFTQPMDAQPFAGSEAFLSKALAAQTNAVQLAARLRDFLENDKAELKSPIKLDLIDANGGKQPCEMALDAKALDTLLADRIRRGVVAFLVEMARLRPELPAGAPIQVLLSGNGSRSRHIKALFDINDPQWAELLASIFDEGQIPEIIVHPPLPMNDVQPHAPTAKTGVALGLLRLVPGENTLLKNHLHAANEGEAPFAWYAGRMRRGMFEPSIAPQAAYGKWQELGPLQQGVFNLYTTQSPRAHSLKEGDAELRKHRLDFPAAAPGARLYACAAKPHVLELVTALNTDELQAPGLSIISFALE